MKPSVIAAALAFAAALSVGGSALADTTHWDEAGWKNGVAECVKAPVHTEDRWVMNGNDRIYGKLFIPEAGAGKKPLVIFSHELGCTHETGEIYAKALSERGVLVYTFDYRGGGLKSRSSGTTRDMSVLTEVSDLEKVLKTAENWPEVDRNHIVIIGASQGGLVASLTAGRHASELEGLVLIYPAFVIHDELHKHYESLSEVPAEVNYNGWIPVGKKYVEDAWNLDPYEGAPGFHKPVLILQGDEDRDVPPYYAYEAARRYPDARLKILHGTGHMFPEEKAKTAAVKDVVRFLDDLHFLPQI